MIRLSVRNFLHELSHSPILRIAVLGMVVGLAAACDKLGLGNNQSPMAPSGPPAPGSTIGYTAIGASDVMGYGSTVPCLLADCLNGTGYVQDAARQLRAQGYAVHVSNLGLPTAVIGPDFEALGQQFDRSIVGNFITQEMPFVLSTTTFVTIFAGGNEVNTITAALGVGAGGNDPVGYINNQVKAFGTDYATLLNGIRSRVGARVVILNLPNLAAMPYLARASLPQRQAAQLASVGMTTNVINALASGNVSIVDLMCDSRTYLASNISSDGFHPNDAGYGFIAGEVVHAATSSSYPAPQVTCGLMTVVPNP
jgi:lysophospholipase L1-like esterase